MDIILAVYPRLMEKSHHCLCQFGLMNQRYWFSEALDLTNIELEGRHFPLYHGKFRRVYRWRICGLYRGRKSHSPPNIDEYDILARTSTRGLCVEMCV